ncbi:MAG TPA: acetoin utilization protein AcuC [Fimbriimonadaceae bacterium]|nr:acetoin utilization protein AcuC [Fimbriimonadaceae bacterium]
MLPNFYYHPRMMSYDFGPQHPLKPERLRRTMALLEHFGAVEPIDPGLGDVADVLRVHDEDYVEAVRKLSEMEAGAWTEDEVMEWAFPFGFGSMDNPPFPGIYEAALAYVAGSAEAARAIKRGEKLAYGIGGGLHHARRREASGFCTFDDCAVACHILLERFEKVAYVDIDVHHGDGVQWIFYDEPRVLTCSIHEDPRTLYPGTGFVTETSVDYTAVNVPVVARTTGDVWLWAFDNGIMPVLEKYRPEAIVLQTGADTHYLDPLAHIQSTAQIWLEAVKRVRDFGVPLVVLGGGGYDMTTVPRMWTAGCLTLHCEDFPAEVPEPFASEWGMPTFMDKLEPGPAGTGKADAEEVVRFIRGHHLASR